MLSNTTFPSISYNINNKNNNSHDDNYTVIKQWFNRSLESEPKFAGWFELHFAQNSYLFGQSIPFNQLTLLLKKCDDENLSTLFQIIVCFINQLVLFLQKRQEPKLHYVSICRINDNKELDNFFNQILVRLQHYIPIQSLTKTIILDQHKNILIQIV